MTRHGLSPNDPLTDFARASTTLALAQWRSRVEGGGAPTSGSKFDMVGARAALQQRDQATEARFDSESRTSGTA